MRHKKGKRKIIKKIKSFIAGSIIVLLINLTIANASLFSLSSSLPSLSTDHGFSSPQYYQPTFSEFYSREGIDYKTYWPILSDREKCEARQDFVLFVPPGGCSPSVVRSDLLEEENVPVFCQVAAIKINPLIDVSWIKSMSFSTREKSPEVSGVGFHPSRAALRTYYEKFSSPVTDNIGYAVVVLKRQPNEKRLPDEVNVSLKARIIYDMEKAFGTGKAVYYLPIIDEKEWERNYEDYSIWKGKAFIRLKWLENNKAALVLYESVEDRERRLGGTILEKIDSYDLDRGKTSPIIYLPGFYCRAGVRLRLDDIVAPGNKAKIEVDNSIFWLREGERFLDDNCRISKIVPKAGGGQVIIRCPRKTLYLSLGSANTIELEKDGKTEKLSLGEQIDDSFLAYIGKPPKSIQGLNEDEKKAFIVLVKLDEMNIIDEKRLASLAEKLSAPNQDFKNKEEYVKSVRNNVAGVFSIKEKLDEKIDVIFYNEAGKFGYTLKKLLGAKDTDYYEYDNEKAELLEEYFEQAIKSVKDTLSFYKNEKTEDETYFYGEIALDEAARLAGSIGKQETQRELLKELVNEYQSDARNAKKELENLERYDYKNAEDTTTIKNKIYSIRLAEIKQPSLDEASALFLFNREEKRLGIRVNSYKNPKDDSEITLNELKDEEAILKYSYTKGSITKTENIPIKVGEKKIIGKTSVELKRIYLKKEARVSVIPEMPNQITETNLSIMIGIEKRAIKLSTDKTKEMIQGLEKDINKWQNVIDKLGKVVKGMKSVCLVTSGILIIKNFINNLGGGAIARKEVMKKWTTYCQEQAKGDDIAFNNCLREHNSEIERDVNIYKDNLAEVNENIKRIQKKNLNNLGNVDEEKATSAYRKHMLDKYHEYVNSDILDTMTFIEIRDLELAILNKQESGIVSEIGQYNLNQTLLDISSRVKKLEANRQAETTFGTGIEVDEESYQHLEIRSYYGQTWQDFKNNNYVFSDTSQTPKQDTQPMQALTLDGGSYVALIDPRGDFYRVKGNDAWYRVQLEDGKRKLVKLTGNELDALKKKGIVFQRQDSSALINPWPDPKIVFHETGSFKGLPAIVPLGNKWGEKRGWYAATKSYDLTKQPIRAYTEAGIPRNFYICNIGKNKIQEFGSSSSDDSCQFVNKDNPPQRILGLSYAESRELIQIAERALMDTASQYKHGIKEISILGSRFDVGAPFISPGVRCQDFMSPQDCYWLFNVCDPVMCPSSRCDLAGSYPVQDVVQTGVIGGIALCLPNYREGIVMPVCLTGIHAGLDSYLSILKAERECLKESLETGRTIGICDEIKSIYLCEFFWRQAVPLTRLTLPKLIETITGQGTRGGGEYLTVSEAWKNMENSVDYIKNEYAVNAFKAFQTRSTEEIGSEFCKMFISASYPSSKKLFDALTEPESPVQFYARFDEIPFSEATVPPTSQYKVYYHIYAGKDEGAYYSVFLKNPPEMAYYAAQAYITVATGYLPRGNYIDETRDFTAPAGYKELCVRINGRDYCGFKQVTTDFGINYLTEKYVEEQATQEIKTEKECIAGKPSLMPLAAPNIQESLSESVSPEIYRRGIVRVCSSENPGKSIDPRIASEESRWRLLGYCGDENIKCWLDTESIKDIIKNRNIENNTLSYTQEISQKIEGIETLSPEQSKNELRSIEQEIEKLELSLSEKELISFTNSRFRNTKQAILLSKLNEIEEKSILSKHKAKAAFLKFRVYKAVIEKLYEEVKKSSESVKQSKPETKPESEEDEEKARELPKDSSILEDVKKNLERYIFKISYKKAEKQEKKYYYYDVAEKVWKTTESDLAFSSDWQKAEWITWRTYSTIREEKRAELGFGVLMKKREQGAELEWRIKPFSEQE